MQRILKKIIPVAAWIIIWQLISMAVHNRILLAGPVDTVRALASLSGTSDFWQSIRATTLRILSGLAIGTVLGLLLSLGAYLKEPLELFLHPLVLCLKSVPVASFVILLLIWFGSENISVIICAMVVFPIIYLNCLEGFKSTDVKLLEMAQVFRMPTDRRLRYILLPQVMPFFRGGLKLATGMSFKSGIAAEVIGQPLHTIGNGLYQAKIYLETGELFAWTIVVVLISYICERLICFIIDLFSHDKSDGEREVSR